MDNRIKKRFFAVIFFVSLFIYQSHVALVKYSDENTSQHSKIEVSLYNILIPSKWLLVARNVWYCIVQCVQLNSVCYVQEVHSIMYPSISNCKKYAFDISKVPFFHDADMDTNKASEWIVENSWGLNWTVYFFTHPGVLNLTFPCTTTLRALHRANPASSQLIGMGRPLIPAFTWTP